MFICFLLTHSYTAGLTVFLTFEQQEGDYMTMHYVQTTSNSAYGTLEKFCNEDTEFEKPIIYLVKDHTNCNDLLAMDAPEVIEVQSIAHDLKPSKYYKGPSLFIFEPKVEKIYLGVFSTHFVPLISILAPKIMK